MYGTVRCPAHRTNGSDASLDVKCRNRLHVCNGTHMYGTSVPVEEPSPASNVDIAGITRLPRSARYSSDGSMAPCRINNGIPSDGDAEGANEGRGGPERHCCEMQCQQRCAKSRKAGNGVR
jgi:hypothetical protein